MHVYGRRYAVEKELGRGGHVFRARDLRIERPVAVKVLAPGGRWVREDARAAGALDHPNIAAVYDAGEQDGEPYIVTELLDGETLRGRLDRGPLAPEGALELAVQLADGLAAAHRKGIVHGDLRPENVFVTGDGQLKILAFGIARPGGRGDARADVFALGAMLSEMVREKPPADGPLARIVGRCLDPDPALRFADAAQVLAALRRARTRRSRKATVLASATVVACLALAVAVAPRPEPQRDASPHPEPIAVLPFVVRATDQSAYLGEGMADLLGVALAANGVPTVDPRALLTHVSRREWSPDPEYWRGVAAQFGTRRYLLGTVTQTRSRLSIHALLYDAAAGPEPVREVRVEGDPAAILELVDAVTARLRGPDQPGRRVRVAEVTSSSPEALHAYLEGLQDQRRRRLEKARAAFERAVVADPSFALAQDALSGNAGQ